MLINESTDLIIIPEEEQHGACLGAKGAPVAIVLTGFAVASKTHDALLQVPFLVADAAMATFGVVHGLGLSPPGLIER